MNDILLVQRREKGLKTKSLDPCPKAVKLYNSGMGGVAVKDQRTAAYRLDRKSSVRFHLCIFFDLMDIACVNSYLIYNLKHPNKINNTSIRKFVMKGKKKIFHPERNQCPTKFSLNYVAYGKDCFEIVLTPPQGLQNAS